MPFQKGNKHGKGRQLGSKNILPLIREKVLQLLDKRLTKGLDATDEALLRFAQSVMPKEHSISLKPDIDFISQVPRPQGIEHSKEDTQVQQVEEVKDNQEGEGEKNCEQMGPNIGGSIHPDTSFDSPKEHPVDVTQPPDMEGVRKNDYYLDKNGNKVYKVD